MSVLGSVVNPFVGSTLLLVVVFVALIFVFVRGRKKNNLPPGPWGLPLVGVLPFLGRDPQLTLMEWAKIYGNIFTVKMGTTTAVILTGYEAIRDVFQRKGALTSGRPHIPTLDFLHGRGLLCADYGMKQRAYREFTLKYLAKADIEKQTEDEIDALLLYIRDTNGEPFDFNRTISSTGSNIIGSILFGGRQDYDDPHFRNVIDAYRHAAELSAQASIQNFLPFLSFLPQCSEGKVAWNTFASHVKRLLDQHKLGYDAGATRGLVDAFLHQFKAGDSEQKWLYTDEDLLANCQTLYFGGSETTSTTLTWGMLYLLSNPDVCEKIHAELEEVVGKTRRPNLADRPHLPYVNATLMEIQRCNYIAPISLPHKATKDTTIGGYVIPEGTSIMANYWSVFMNEDFWPNPREFRPSRFFDEHGNLKRVENFIPFSIGKRSCPGEILARQEMFLVFTALVRTFTFHLPKGEVLPELAGTTGAVYVPPRFCVCARPRI
ncbi:cytochrome P450 2J2 [Lingula anatina]|uniref:Cytochrome P450 2J2 n=1 Tax=Lingula anatina TaxID=7574 RepID=A0A1S3JTS5_LINAN|nr:cytochrome P450 2J2 [Lingula anatina]|eukprot:XP_013413728.1 cytochrome P450 2J2 [Lingula anatina]